MRSLTLPLFFLLGLLAGGCSDNPPGRGPRDVLFAYGNGEGLYVLRGDGSLKQQVIGGSYYQPVLSPDHSRIACLYDKDFQITIFDLDGNFEPVGKPKTVLNSQAFSRGSAMSGVCCPVWSADGQKLYFLNQNHLIVYDYPEKKTTSLFDFPENQTGGQTPETGNLKLSKDGGDLYMMLSEGMDKLAFWTFNPSSNQGTLVASTGRDLLGGFKFPPEMPEGMIEAFFGSRENPAAGSVPTPDYHFYFYYFKDQGPLANYGLKGYNRETKEIFIVANLGTSLFSN